MLGAIVTQSPISAETTGSAVSAQRAVLNLGANIASIAINANSYGAHELAEAVPILCARGAFDTVVASI